MIPSVQKQYVAQDSFWVLTELQTWFISLLSGVSMGGLCTYWPAPAKQDLVKNPYDSAAFSLTDDGEPQTLRPIHANMKNHEKKSAHL